MFVYAAYTKLRQSWLLFALSIDSYQLLPEWAVFALARTLPALELALGVLLIAGVWLRYLSIVAAAILALFFSVMVVSYFRGAGIDCGCFGVGEPLSVQERCCATASYSRPHSRSWCSRDRAFGSGLSASGQEPKALEPSRDPVCPGVRHPRRADCRA